MHVVGGLLAGLKSNALVTCQPMMFIGETMLLILVCLAGSLDVCTFRIALGKIEVFHLRPT